MFRYETHLHTSPVSACARFSVRENLLFYKKLGYAGVFITNHFLDGNIRVDAALSYAEKIEFYCSDYEEGLKIGAEIGLPVYFGVEMSYRGTDFLAYGLDKAWYLAHPEIMDMKKSALLPFLKENGALVIQAHPYREASYIDHIRLYPRCVHGMETDNACRTDFENEMAAHCVKAYGLLPFAGSDNHTGPKQKRLSGVQFGTPIKDEADFVTRVLAGEAELFSLMNESAE